MMVTVFSLFFFAQDILSSYNLDFILVAALLLIDLIYYIVQLVSYCKNGMS